MRQCPPDGRIELERRGGLSWLSSSTSGTSGIITTTSITCTSIDGIAAGEPFRLKIARLPADGSDTMAGDAELVAVELRSAA